MLLLDAPHLRIFRLGTALLTSSAILGGIFLYSQQYVFSDC